ncbi:hypothetical protein ACVWW4_003957 [Bradyrhizobium sp. LB7.1]
MLLPKLPQCLRSSAPIAILAVARVRPTRFVDHRPPKACLFGCLTVVLNCGTPGGADLARHGAGDCYAGIDHLVGVVRFNSGAAVSLADTHLIVLAAAIGSGLICARGTGFLVSRLGMQPLVQFWWLMGP